MATDLATPPATPPAVKPDKSTAAQPKTRLYIYLGVGGLLLVVAGYLVWRAVSPPAGGPPEAASLSTSTESWQEEGVAVAGKYADADVIQLPDGHLRMYYAVEPEVSGNQLEVYSALSTDGRTWEQEAGTRRTFSTFPDVVALPDGRLRMYFQNSGVIKSAASTDGLSWTDEAGTRISSTEEGFDLDSVGAPTTLALADGTYLMIYAGNLEGEKFRADTPSNKIELLFAATSTDGLTWQKKGSVLDTRNDTLLGLADGPDLVRWDDDSIRLYFWGYAGVYYATYADGALTAPTLTLPAAAATGPDGVPAAFPPNPPGDPTLIKIGGDWFMYYGQHEKGIFYATGS